MQFKNLLREWCSIPVQNRKNKLISLFTKKALYMVATDWASFISLPYLKK